MVMIRIVRIRVMLRVRVRVSLWVNVMLAVRTGTENRACHVCLSVPDGK